MGFLRPEKLLISLLLTLLPAVAMASEWRAQRLLEFGLDSCRGWQASAAPASGFGAEIVNQSEIKFRENRIGTRFRLQLETMATVEFDVIDRGGRPSRFVSSLFNRFGDPLLLVALDSDCEPQVARRIDYNENGQATSIVSLDGNMAPRGQPEWLNPALEFVERDATALKHPGEATPLRVGMVDSGVNYLLPEINRRLARDADNRLIGYDFWDMDDRPFDAHPVNSGFFVQRHGTRTASILLREAPGVELVPYRYPRPDMTRMQALIEHAADNGVEILGMPLGSNRPQDWSIFERSARAHPRMLFVVSAGNNGRNIDEHPVFPAVLDLDNILVVTSSNDFVRPAERTNWGRISVDYLVPAERLPATDFSGRQTRVSGSSYAVSRITALAARLKTSRPDWHAADIVAELRRRYGGATEVTGKWVSSGYIADPLAGAPLTMTPMTDLEALSGNSQGDSPLSLEVLVVDPSWTTERVKQALRGAYGILGQCDISVGNISVQRVDGADYLRDLSTGSAHTLLGAAKTDKLKVVFARDTRMQAQFTGEAFGIANTRMRPWLANSVWMMLDVDDAGIALAHELYHVLANNGAHVDGGANLMQGRTRPDSTMLTPRQCQLAVETGRGNQLFD